VVSLRAEREQATALLRRDRWRLGIVIGVVLLAIAGLLVLAGGKPVPPGRSEYDAGTTGPVAVAVPVLAGYAEQTRGLRFRRPPLVRVADAATVARAAAESTAVDSGGRALTDRALGFAGRPPTTPPAAAYSYRQHAVYLRQVQPVDPAARVALVHALTLALQDQNADLAGLRRQAADDPDRTRAVAALVEGDATRIELAYLASLPAGDQTAVRAKHDHPPARPHTGSWRRHSRRRSGETSQRRWPNRAATRRWTRRSAGRRPRRHRSSTRRRTRTGSSRWACGRRRARDSGSTRAPSASSGWRL
jgi:hypothetical protein